MSAAKQAALFVGIVVVVVGGAAVAPFATGSQSTQYTPVENQNFNPDAILAPESPESGQIAMDSSASGKTILIDAGHENDFSKAQIQPLVSTLTRNGHTVRFYRGQSQSLNQSLRSADAYVVVNPRRPHTPSEVAGVEAFADAGGRVLLLGDPPAVQVGGGLLFGVVEEVSYRQTGLASPLGVAFDAGYLYDMEENDNNFKSIYATPAGDGELTAGVDRLVMREAAPLATGGGSAVATGESTTLSTTRRTGDYAVAVRNGDVAAVGDTDFLAREDVYEADNEVFVGNLADFLVSGDKEPGAPKKPKPEGAPRPGEPMPPRPPSGGTAPAPTPAPTEAPA